MITKYMQLQVGDKTVYIAELVNSVSKSCYYNIHNIGSIRNYITRNACKTLAHALIIPRLDYGNALLYWLLGTLMTHP